MAIDKATAASWLEWADKQLAANGGNSRPSGWDKATAPFIIGKYTTWQAVYDAALKEYERNGATEEEIKQSSPIQTKREVSKKKKADATAAEAREIADPFGVNIDKYKLIVNTDEDGAQEVRGIMPGSEVAVPMYMYASAGVKFNKPTGIGRASVGVQTDNSLSFSEDYNSVRNKILLDARVTPGGTDALFTKLYSTGGLTKETYESKNISAPDFAKSLKYMVDQYSIKAVNDYQVYGKIEPLTFDKFLESEFKTDKGSKTTYDMVQTTRQDAADEANQFFMQYLGRSATKDERDEYYKLLRSEESKAIRYTTVTEDGNRISKGDLLTETDRTLIMGKVAGNAIKGTDVDTLLKSGGKASQNVDYILETANQYGIRMSREQAMNYVANNLRSGRDLESTKQKIIEISKSNYKGIADKISDNVSVKELAGNYLWQKAQTLELSEDTMDVFDSDIQDAVNGNMTMTDFKKKLRQNPAWAKTKNAKEEAANYATDILKSFGLMA
jgi:hypothetical protein